MFSDPISITINSVAKSFARISQQGNSAVYQTADGLYRLTISHQTTNKGRIRTLFKMEQKKLVTSPIDSSNDYDTEIIATTFDRPAFGFTNTDVNNDWAGYKAYLDSTAIGKLLGMEV